MERITFSTGPKTRTYEPALDSKLRPNEINRIVSLTGIAHVPLRQIDFFAPGSLRKILSSQYVSVSPRFNDDMALDEKPPCYRNYASEWLDILPNKSKYITHDYLINYGRQVQTIYSEPPFMESDLRVEYEHQFAESWAPTQKREGDDSVFDSEYERRRQLWPSQEYCSNRKGLLSNLVSYDPRDCPVPLDGRQYFDHLDYWTIPEAYFTLPYTGKPAKPLVLEHKLRSSNYSFNFPNEPIHGDYSSWDATWKPLFKFPLRRKNQGSSMIWNVNSGRFEPRYTPDFAVGTLQMTYVPTVKDDRAKAKRDRKVKIKTFREKCDDMQTRKKVARCHKVHDAINQSLSAWNPLEILKDLLAPLVEKFKYFLEGMKVVEWFGEVKEGFTNAMDKFALAIVENRAFISIWMANLIMGKHDSYSFFMHMMTFISVMMPWAINGTAEFLAKIMMELGSWATAKNQGSGFSLSKLFASFYNITVPKNLFSDIVIKLRSLSTFSKGIKDGFGMLKWIGKAFERFRIWCGIGVLKGQFIPDTKYELTQWAADISDLSEMTSVDMQEPTNRELLKKVIVGAAAVTKFGIIEGFNARSQIWIKSCVTTVEQLSKTYHQQLRMVIPSMRPAPLWISMSGGSGVGKSLMMNRIGKALFHPKAKAPINRLIDPDNLFYFCNTSTKYDDQYRNQPIFAVDDIFQIKSNEQTGKEEAESMFVINFVGPVPCEVNNSQAGLKGGINMSEIFLTTSNITYPIKSEIQDNRALHRRAAVRVWVERDKTVNFGPEALKYYVLPSVMARSEQGKFIELDDDEEMPSGYQLMTEASWEHCKNEILTRITPMTEREFINYTLKVWKQRVKFSSTNSFNAELDDDYFDCGVPERAKFTTVRPTSTTSKIPKATHNNQGHSNQRLGRGAKAMLLEPLISVMGGCYLIGSASYQYNPLNETICWVLGAILVINFLWDFLFPIIAILRNQGTYSHDKNTVAKSGARLRSPALVTWKNHGNLTNTRDQIKQMCVKLTLRCGDDTYSFSGLAYGGRDIIVNEHCLGLLFNNPDEDVTILVKDYQNVEREYAIDESMVMDSDTDMSILRIPDMPMMKQRDHLFCEVLPDHGDQVNVATYCMRTQTFNTSKAIMNASGPNDIPLDKPAPPCQYFTADIYPYYYCNFITVVDASMKPGDCGSPVIDLQSGKIMGIHVATSGESDDFIPFLRCHLPVQKSFDAPDTETVEHNGFVGVASPHNNYVSRKSNLVRSAIHATFPVKKAPASLSRHHPNGDVLWNGFEKGFQGNKPYPIKDVDRAVEFVSSKVRTYEASLLGRRVLTDDETLNGMPGVYNGMILSTSMGSPYKDKAQKSGKYDIFDMVDGVRHWSNTDLSKEVQERIVEVEKDLNEGIVPCEYMTEQLKDEAVSLAKVESGKTRTFRTLSVVMNYLYRKHFGAMVAAVEQHPDTNEVALGLNVHGHHWTRLYHRLNKFGGNVLAGDYANWDRSLSSQLINTLKRLAAAFYGYESKARDALIDYLISSPVIVEGLMFYPHQGLPSGVAMTTLFGSLINFVVIVLAIIFILREHNMLHLLNHEYMEFTFYGDDHIVALHPALQQYVTFQKVREIMTRHGLGYTPADKSDRVFDFEGLREVPYLKRTFKPISPMMVQAPLDMASIENMVQWQDRRLPKMEFIKAVWTSICQESVYHGQEKFTEITQIVLNRVFEECDRRGWNRPVFNTDYSHWYNNWIVSRI